MPIAGLTGLLGERQKVILKGESELIEEGRAREAS